MRSRPRRPRLALVLLLARPPGAEQRALPVDALELAFPGIGEPPVVLADLVLHVLGDEHAAGLRDVRDPAREVHRAPEPVAAARERLARRDAGTERGEVVAGLLARLDEPLG